MSAVKEVALTPAKPYELPDGVVRRGLNHAQWNTLCKSLFPGANPNSVLLVVDYCQARRLDPLKKPCHIVPMEVKDAKTGNYEWRDVVMPGIYEHRTTAQRTNEYLGHDRPVYGPDVEWMGVKAPEWCEMTMYRWNGSAQQRAEFPVRVLFREAVAVTKDRKTQEWKANSRWSKAPVQMLTKCCEAAGLREAFPDEIGGEQTAEEMDGQRAIDASVVDVTARVLPAKPDKYDDWMLDLASVADSGAAAFAKAWADSPEPCRTYLAATDPDRLEDLKSKAENPARTPGEDDQ